MIFDELRLESSRVLWKHRLTPLDNTVREILKKYKDDERLDWFCESYILTRNMLIENIITSIQYKRAIDSSGMVGPRKTIGVYHNVLPTFIGMMDCGHLTYSNLRCYHQYLVNGDIIFALNYLANLKANAPPLPRSYGPTVDDWYNYVRKAMGVYNVPRPDLEIRQMAALARKELSAKMWKVVNDIIAAKEQPPT